MRADAAPAHRLTPTLATHLFLSGSGARPLHFIRNSGVAAELLVILLEITHRDERCRPVARNLRDIVENLRAWSPPKGIGNPARPGLGEDLAASFQVAQAKGCAPDDLRRPTPTPR